MADYPDWTRLFHLVGTEITIPIRIEASDVTLPVSIDAATATVPIDIKAATVAINVRLFSSMITLNVNLHSQTANINFAFADQSVAVFDAAKWFAHKAKQIFFHGAALVSENSYAVVASRTVPANRRFFINGVACCVHATAVVPNATAVEVRVEGAIIAHVGSRSGTGITFDVPLRAEAGEQVDIWVWWWGAAANPNCDGGAWGYDEVV